MLDTPVLLITFNRPDHTRSVLEAIVAARPRDLYVFQDGARAGSDSDASRCLLVRQTVEELTQGTPIRLHTYYSDTNLGCGAGPAKGIGWFFGNEERGIVMEDDCLPHPHFFEYCQQLLQKYQDSPDVLFINATHYRDRWQCSASYGFSRYMVTGAWAGWRRTWQGFDLDLDSLDALKFRKHVLRLTRNRGEANWWYALVKEIQQDRNKKSYWDYQMQIHLFRRSALTIHPRCNLISNIGFDPNGTHTTDNAVMYGARPTYPILPLTHPADTAVDTVRDARCWAKGHSRGWLRDTVAFLYNRLLWSDGMGHSLLMRYKKIHGKGVNTKRI